MRSDVAVWMVEPGDDRVRLDLARLPAVTQVEATRFVPVVLHHGHRSERSLIRGYEGRATLYRVVDAENRATLLDGRGLVITDRLADKLDLRVGETVRVEVLEGRPRSVELTVGATVREMMGLNAYMERGALNRALGDGDLASGFVLAVERGHEDALLEAIKALPRVAGAFSKATMLRNMQEISARNVRIMSTILTAFAAVIAVGVVYNNARIALAERGWELASLRVLGFTRAEVSALLLGELALVIAVALPLGMGLGFALVHLISALLASDQFYFPVVIQPRTYAWAALAVLAAGVVSALVVRRRIDESGRAIDLQVDFLASDGYFARKGYDPSPLRAIIPNVNAVIAAARGAEIDPVGDLAGFRGGELGEYALRLAEAPGELQRESERGLRMGRRRVEFERSEAVHDTGHTRQAGEGADRSELANVGDTPRWCMRKA